MKRFPTNYLFASLILLVFLGLSACSSPQRLLDEGDYDVVIEKSLARLKGKTNKDEEQVAALETAFERATSRDLAAVEQLRPSSDPARWPDMFRIYSRIANRQALVEPLIPLVDKNGYEAQFQFVRVVPLLAEAREKSAAYFYSQGRQLLQESQSTGNRMRGREAHAAFLRIQEYETNFLDTQSLLEASLEAGKSHVLISLVNDSPVMLDKSFEDALLSIGTRDLDSRWTRFYTREFGDFNFDYVVAVKFRTIQVSPGVIQEKSYQEVREIEEGFEYVLDARGNVRKDSLGNDIKIPKKVKIVADVLEVYQRKAAKMEGFIEIRDAYTNNTLETEPLFAENVFEHYAATFKGDERALSEESKRRIGNRPVNFPDDATMVLALADRFKPVLTQKIRSSGLFR
jgi:hypothetical protein